MPTVSDRLKELRKQNNVTQAEVAKQSNMTERAYQRLEAGSKPNHDSLIALADYFNVSADYLLGRSDEPIIGDEIFAQRLIDCRKSKNVTEEDVAEYLGMDVGVYLKYEAAFHSPSVNMLNKLADYFKVSVDYLVGYEPSDGV